MVMYYSKTVSSKQEKFGEKMNRYRLAVHHTQPLKEDRHPNTDIIQRSAT